MRRSFGRRSFLGGAGVLVGSAAVSRPAFAGAEAADPASQSGSGVEVQLLNITDLHGYLQPPAATDGGVITGAAGAKVTVGGVGYLGTHLKALRAGHANSIFFSSGDNFSGWPFEIDVHANEPTVEALNAMNLQFSTIGNHELDHSVDFLVNHMEKGIPYPVAGRDDSFIDSAGRRFHGAKFPYYTANIVQTDNGKTIRPPYNIVWVDAGHGRKLPIAFIHLTVPDTPTGSTSYQPALSSLDSTTAANEVAAGLKRRGINAIIVNIHDGGVAGSDYNSGSSPSGPVFDMAAKLSPDIAALVTGHWHCRFNMMVNDPNGVPRPVVEAGNYGQLVNEINLTLDRKTGEVVRDLTVSTNHAVTRDVPVDEELQDIADYWTAQGQKRYATPLAKLTADITRTPNSVGQTTMGNLAADWAFWDAKQIRGNTVDLAMVAVKPATGSSPFSGDLLYAKGSNPADADGRILFGEAWTAFGYGDPALTVTVTGAQIRAALEQQWQQQSDGTVKFAPFAVSANVSVQFDDTEPVGDRVNPADVVINGKPLDVSANYRLVALVYTLIGADGYTAFTGFTDPQRGPNRDHESFIAYVRAHPVISPTPLDRVRRKS